jgi:hypothetical protein
MGVEEGEEVQTKGTANLFNRIIATLGNNPGALQPKNVSRICGIYTQ